MADWEEDGGCVPVLGIPSDHCHTDLPGLLSAWLVARLSGEKAPEVWGQALLRQAKPGKGGREQRGAFIETLHPESSRLPTLLVAARPPHGRGD